MTIFTSNKPEDRQNQAWAELTYTAGGLVNMYLAGPSEVDKLGYWPGIGQVVAIGRAAYGPHSAGRLKLLGFF